MAQTQMLNSPEFAALGLPFSEAVRVGDVVYVSGQLGHDRGALVPGGIEAETKQTLENIKVCLERHGLSLADVVKCTIFMTDMSEWFAMNAVYMAYFDRPGPARSALGCSGLALGARVEIECVAAIRD